MVIYPFLVFCILRCARWYRFKNMAAFQNLKMSFMVGCAAFMGTTNVVLVLKAHINNRGGN